MHGEMYYQLAKLHEKKNRECDKHIIAQNKNRFSLLY